MHSKGPWRIDNWDEVDQGGREYVDILDAEGVCICTVVDRDSAIVAAAPLMLEALKAVAECKFCILCQTCRNKVDAAIAKAEGRKKKESNQ